MMGSFTGLVLFFGLGCSSPIQSGGSVEAIDNTKNQPNAEPTMTADNKLIVMTTKACQRLQTEELCQCVSSELFVGKMTRTEMERFSMAMVQKEPWATELRDKANDKCTSDQTPL